ncbi:MAG: UvrD-helicase domain-containing protein, partial [Pseudoalteromonas sp.]|uniref:UvrD-helicase domain-containing protein n=1 Tax=Pseudoalteromonas sp. TaxID=53249 RepID=UPI0025F81EE5
MKQPELKITAHFITRLFGNRFDEIKFGSTNGSLKKADGKIVSFRLKDLKTPPKISSGIFFSTLEISPTLYIKGLPKKSTEYLHKHILISWYDIRFKEASYLRSKIECVLLESYVRSSSFEKLKEKALVFWHGNPIEFNDSLLSKEKKETFGFLYDMAERSSLILTEYRKRYVEGQKEKFKTFFKTIETNPLTERQCSACIIDNDNNLVLAGAGTGKTSTIIGRAGYLIESKQANPKDILILAFGKRAKEELEVRIEKKLNNADITVNTFHSLGKSIVETVENRSCLISTLATDEKLKAKFIDDCLDELLGNKIFAKKAITYFSKYLYPQKNRLDFKTKDEYLDYIKCNDIRTFKGELVKSYGECQIANFLFINGIDYKYEANYKYP